MKDSRTYGQKIGKLFRSLKQKYAKVKKVNFDEPAYALVYAIVSERTRASKAKTIVKRIEKHFAGLNDLRVSRTEEILDILGASSEDSRKTASMLTQVLNSIYNRYNMVSLASLKELEKLDGLSSFAVNYCFLTALRGHSIPLTRKMIGYLKAGELVHPDATDDEISGFLERQITAANAYEFYSLLRQESEKAKSSKPAGKEARKAVRKSGKKATRTRKS